MRGIETEQDVARGLEALIARAPAFARVVPLAGPLPLRRRADGFEALRDAVLGQQVSVAAAAAIRARLEAAGLGAAGAIAGAPDEALRGCGLSRQKIRYLRALAGAGLDYAALRAAPDAQVYAALVALPGIGRWTAEMYMIFALGRPDVFAPDDMALQEGARLLFGLETRPKPKALAEMAAPWAPWRAIAARALWAYYGAARSRQGETL